MDVRQASRELGISRSTFDERMQTFGIKIIRFPNTVGKPQLFFLTDEIQKLKPSIPRGAHTSSGGMDTDLTSFETIARRIGLACETVRRAYDEGMKKLSRRVRRPYNTCP